MAASRGDIVLSFVVFVVFFAKLQVGSVAARKILRCCPCAHLLVRIYDGR
jgi:hypothetical protein